MSVALVRVPAEAVNNMFFVSEFGNGEVLDASFADACSATACGVETSPECGVVVNKCLACVA